MEEKDLLSFDEENSFTITDENGNEQLCKIFLTLENEETGKKYVLFTYASDLEKMGDDDEEGIEVGAAEYIEGEDGHGDLVEIATDEEWSFIEEKLHEYEDEMEECEHEHCHCCEDGSEVCECECDDEEEECCCHHHHHE